MDVSSNPLQLCAAASPIIAAIARRLASRHGLQACDRQDVKQALYLALLTGWAAASPSLLAPAKQPADEQTPGHTAALHAYLAREAERIAGSLPSGRPFRRTQPSSAQPLAPPLIGRLSARPPRDASDAHDLRMDLATAMSRLPDDLRELCCRLADDGPVACDGLHPQWPGAVELGERMVALRARFVSLGLHHYL